MSENSRHLGRALRTAIAVVSLGALIYAGRDQLSDLDLLLTVGLLHVTALSVLFLGGHLGLAALWSWALRIQSCRLNLSDSLLLIFMRTYFNLLFPWAGGTAAGVFLKRRLQLPYTTYAHLAWEINWLNLSVAAAAGATALALFSHDIPHATALTLAFIALTIASFGLACVFRLPCDRRFLPGRAGQWLRQYAGPLATALPAPPLIALLIVLALVRITRTWILFAAVGFPVSPVDAVILTLLAELSVAINLTPNGLGIREAAISLTAAFIGHDAGVGLAAAILDRLIFTAWTLLVGQFAIWKLDWTPRKKI